MMDGVVHSVHFLMINQSQHVMPVVLTNKMKKIYGHAQNVNLKINQRHHDVYLVVHPNQFRLHIHHYPIQHPLKYTKQKQPK